MILFTFKVVAGIAYVLLYTYYYTDRSTADIYKYFDDGYILFESATKHPIDFIKMLTGIGNDTSYFNKNYYDKMHHWYRGFNSFLYSNTHMIIRFNALLHLVSNHNIYIHHLIINMLSFTGIFYFYKSFRAYISSPKLFGITLYLFPAILFWSSGLTKEGLLTSFIGPLLYFFHKILKGERYLIWISSFVFLGICMLFIKPYIAICILIPLLFYFIVNQFFITHKWVTYLALSGVSILLLIVIQETGIFNFERILIGKQSDFIELAINSKANSSFELIKINSLTHAISLFPYGIVNVILKPYIWKANNSFILLTSLGNIITLLAFIIGWIFYRRSKINKGILYTTILIITCIYGIIGITTPVLGSLVRYKVIGLLFFVTLFYLITDLKKTASICSKKI